MPVNVEVSSFPLKLTLIFTTTTFESRALEARCCSTQRSGACFRTLVAQGVAAWRANAYAWFTYSCLRISEERVLTLSVVFSCQKATQLSKAGDTS